MKRICGFTALFLACVIFAGCAAHIHQVGSGAQGNSMTEARQWYILWGLVPINDVDTHSMTEGATNYTIKTEQSALDVVINIFTGMVTVGSRTVTVTK
ncbi:MAG: hypothetical protein KAY24_14025 [Candidatus Eisenbacteria sp.]|nr:hypothetical protein [Candidatus Eisenbacteria bacterium]